MKGRILFTLFFLNFILIPLFCFTPVLAEEEEVPEESACSVTKKGLWKPVYHISCEKKIGIGRLRTDVGFSLSIGFCDDPKKVAYSITLGKEIISKEETFDDLNLAVLEGPFKLASVGIQLDYKDPQLKVYLYVDSFLTPKFRFFLTRQTIASCSSGKATILGLIFGGFALLALMGILIRKFCFARKYNKTALFLQKT